MRQHTLVWQPETAQIVLAVSGDLGGSPDARRAFTVALDTLADLHDTHAQAIMVIDMTRAGFLESSALNALVRVHRHTGRQLHVRLTADQTFIQRVIAISGLDQTLAVEITSPSEAAETRVV